MESFLCKQRKNLAIFDKKELHVGTFAAKALRIIISIYLLLKSES